jgi:bacillithiol biosynthesis cysteine-adding enzyme BshC
LPADILGLSAVARAGLSGSDGSSLPLVQRLEQIPEPTERLTALERKQLAEDLGKGLSALEIPGRVATSISLLERPGTTCVITGQQPGLVGGPLYTLYKAMQACRLSHELSNKWGQPVVPVFWNHADDHDWAEVHHAWVLNSNHDLQKLGLAGAGSSRMPIGKVLLTEEHHQLQSMSAGLRQAFGDSKHVEWALELLLPRPGETLARALTRGLTALLGTHGLVVLEPDWIRPALSRALAGVVGSNPLQPLQMAKDPAIDPSRAALAFHVTDAGRRALRPGGDGFEEDGRDGSCTPSELAALIIQDPEDWSAGALLRPLVQDIALPVAVTIGGYGEYAYHRQLVHVRESLGIPITPFAPRVSLTVVDGETSRALAVEDTTPEQVMRTKGDWRPPAAIEDEPAILKQLETLEQNQRAELLSLREALSQLEPALGSSLKRTANLNAKEVARLTRKARRVHQNQAGRGDRHVRRLNHALMPRTLPQERVLTALQFMAPHGPEWVDSLYAEIPALSTEHLLVQLPETARPKTPEDA